MFRSVVVFCALAALATAFLEHMTLQPIPEKFKDQKGCYIPELDVVVPFGKSVPSKERCVEYRCGSNVVTIAGCSVVVARPPCKVVEDKNNLYSDCCPKIECHRRD